MTVLRLRAVDSYCGAIFLAESLSTLRAAPPRAPALLPVLEPRFVV